MSADGVGRDVQQRTNLFAGQSFDQAVQHLELSRCEERNGFGLGPGRALLREGEQDSIQQRRRQVGLSACRSPDRHQQRLDLTLLGHPAPHSQLHGLADPVVISSSRDDHDPDVGPLVTQLAADRQPILARQAEVKGHDVDLVVREQLQGLHG